MILRWTTLVVLCVCLPSSVSAQSNSALLDRAADRIVRGALIRDAALSAGLSAIDAHARHEDERLAVSVARAVVFSVRDRRGQAGYDADLQSAGEHANRQMKPGLEMLTKGGDFLPALLASRQRVSGMLAPFRR